MMIEFAAMSASMLRWPSIGDLRAHNIHHSCNLQVITRNVRVQELLSPDFAAREDTREATQTSWTYP